MDTLQFWNTYQKDIKSFIQSKVKSEQIAEDLTQETFLKVHLKKEQLKESSKAKSWLFTMARNIVMDHFKKTKRSTTLPEDQIPDQTQTSYAHSEKDCLPGLIKNLPKHYRDPLYLADVKGMKQSAIAAQLKLPLSTVKSQIQRGRKLIIKGYMDCCNYTLDAKGRLVGEVKEASDCKVCRSKA